MKKVTIILHVQCNEEDTDNSIEGGVRELCSNVFLDLGNSTSVQSIDVEEVKDEIREYKPITVKFEFKGTQQEFTFTPESQDEWNGFGNADGSFDVHYCEEYNEVCVYEVVNGETKTDLTLTSSINYN